MTKKNIAFGVLALAATATLSQAAVIFSSDKVATQNGFDIYDITITGLTGADAQPGPNGTGVSSMSGTFTATTGSFLTPGKSANAASNNTTINGSDPLSAAGSSGPGNYTGTSYVSMDTVLNFSRVGPAPTTANQHSNTSTSFKGDYGILGGTYLGPSTFTGGPAGSNGPDNPLFAELIVTAGGAGNYTGTVTSVQNGGSTISNVVIPFGAVVNPTPGLSITSPASSPTTHITGTGKNYNAAVLGNNGSFTLDGTPTGDAIAGFDFSGGPVDFGTSLPVGASVLTGSAAAPFIALFNSLTPGASYDTIVDLGGSTSGNLVLSNLPAGVTVAGEAVVPEPTTIGLVGLGAVLAMNRRRRQA